MNKQQEMLQFICKHNKEKGYSPTFREIGDAVGYKSSCTVHRHIGKLEEQGLLQRVPSSPRTLEVVSDRQQMSEVQIIESHNDVQTVILWQGNRYVLDPMG